MRTPPCQLLLVLLLPALFAVGATSPPPVDTFSGRAEVRLLDLDLWLRRGRRSSLAVFLRDLNGARSFARVVEVPEIEVR